ncbi:sensor histidine kinase [Terriglobus tenax]|uniref:sensor histidine kinase n=1 Tax=Terriglobus tenax TaxID=1111115 RepID=UPI0021E05169|nr:ATP-binding protein [Terriglobus tenax]
MATATPEAPTPACTPVDEIIVALRRVEALDGLTDADYLWLAENGTEQKLSAGQEVFQEGDPADRMTILLQGEVHVRRRERGSVAFFISRVGQLSGLLPYSRMQTYGGTGYAVGDVWGLHILRNQFDDLLRAIPSMGQRCVSTLLNRVREVTRMEQQSEKIAALGKLAANLSHELNNPASAAQRAASSLLGELRTYGDLKYQLGSLCLTEEQKAMYRQWVTRLRLKSPTGSRPVLARDSIAISNREDDFGQWLTEHNVADPWKFAPVLAETTLEVCDLDELSLIGADILPIAIGTISSAIRTERMTETVIDATVRIFDLITAIKDYSYMDQAPIQDIDLAAALDNTLAMLGSRLTHITVERDFDPLLPPVPAYGSELNQVFTAIIENALDAMQDNGTLRLRTRTSGQLALVEIWDSGPGIPVELQSRIFEPFFTTKAPGFGLGLGLDTVQRIISKHSGHISVESKPGATCFQVRLPIEQMQAY